MNLRQARQIVLETLREIYPEAEASVISGMLLEGVTGQTSSIQQRQPDSLLNDEMEARLHQYLRRLALHEPIQYVLGEAWFLGMKLSVNQHVLIPRPETEELVDWVWREEDLKGKKILDVGTGSGCIAIGIARRSIASEIWAVDISGEALQVASSNAAQQGGNIRLLRLDFLKASDRASLPVFDLIVSNPPYIPASQGLSMDPHVVGFEPHLALFVETERPLIFYEALAGFAADHLAAAGSVYLEIHEDLAAGVCEVFNRANLKTTVRKDMQGKERMVRAKRLI